MSNERAVPIPEARTTKEIYLLIMTQNTISTHDGLSLIERIAALQAEVDALKAENAAHVHDLGHLQNVNCKLQAEVARLSAPVTDAEWAVSHWVKSGGSMRGFVDAVILARATPPQDVEKS